MRHYQMPYGYGRLSKADLTFEGANPSCGDQLIFDVFLDSQKRIKALGWEGKGCVISQASASLLSQMIQQKTLNAVKRVNPKIFLKELGIPLSPTRRKCALLALFTIQREP